MRFSGLCRAYFSVVFMFVSLFFFPLGGEGSPMVDSDREITNALAQDVASACGVRVDSLADSNRLSFFVSVGKARTQMHECRCNQGELQIARAKLTSLRVTMHCELERRFHVKIGRAGEVAGIQSFSLRGLPSENCQLRDPNMSELYAVEYAIERSQPSHLAGKGNGTVGIAIYFLKETRCGDRAADWCFDQNRHPAIFIEPNYSRGGQTLEELIVHELAHNAMYRMGFDPALALEWKPARELGWLPFHNFRTGERGWMLRSKESESYFYKIGRYSGQWLRCDREGQPLTITGNVANARQQAYSPEVEEVANAALVRPVSDYFPTPFEMMAEALMLYRSGSQSRARLLSLSPDLYTVVKNFDQSEIDRTFGKQVMIRKPDGLIAQLSNDVCSQVAAFENGGSRLELTVQSANPNYMALHSAGENR